MSGSGIDFETSARLRDIAEYLIEVAERSEDAVSSNLGMAIPLGEKALQFDLGILSQLAKEELRERRSRSTVFDPELFGEPAWDMLLDLFVAKVAAKNVSITSACIAADVPPTTALRWLSILEQQKLVSRSADEFDQRRSWVALTDHGFAVLKIYLSRRASQRGRTLPASLYSPQTSD